MDQKWLEESYVIEMKRFLKVIPDVIENISVTLQNVTKKVSFLHLHSTNSFVLGDKRWKIIWNSTEGLETFYKQ